MSTSSPPQSTEERKPLTSQQHASSNLSDTTGLGENVADLRDQLVSVQRKLEKALRITEDEGESFVNNKNAGHVDVDFVRTKPSKRGRVRCKRINMKTILHSFHAVSVNISLQIIVCKGYYFGEIFV